MYRTYLDFIRDTASFNDSPAITTGPMSGKFIEPSLFNGKLRFHLFDLLIEYLIHLQSLKIC